MLALSLARAGVRVRIVDRALQPGTTSRALVLHARTLEFYRQLGIADEVVREGLPFTTVNLWVRGRHRARVQLGAIGAGLSPFPYMVVFPQDEHEPLLVRHLARAGVEIERGVELTGIEEDGDGVVARLRGPEGESLCRAAYLAGCDGARSAVRELLGTGFEGSTYQHRFYVADLEATGPVVNHELHLELEESDFLGAFPLRSKDQVRLIGTVRAEAVRDGPLTWEEIRPKSVDRMRITVTGVRWCSTYHVHHRVASRFRRGRVFLLGDAAHIHSPVGGQGMNTGIGDAINLGWKLAETLQGRAPASLLDSYETERKAFARQLVATTDRAFTLATSDGPLARFVRLQVVPLVLPPLFRLDAMKRLMFRTVSQTRVTYRSCDLNAGRAGPVHGGDRLPWTLVEGTRGDNHHPLDGRRWQVHVYGDAADSTAAFCQARGIALEVFPWENRMTANGFRRDALYLVRPDGYVGFADQDQQAGRLERFLDGER